MIRAAIEYADRQDAGRRLAEPLLRYQDTDVVVSALPRGGVVVGAEVARILGAPLGIVQVRKLGHPFHPEYAVGAIAEDEKPLYNENETALLNATWLKQAEANARNIILRRRQYYYGDEIRPPEITGKPVIIVDDGIATGLTMEAAIQAVRRQAPQRIIVAVPVAAWDSVGLLEGVADEVIVLSDPKEFLGAVSVHYQSFPQVEDEEVKALLQEAHHGL